MRLVAIVAGEPFKSRGGACFIEIEPVSDTFRGDTAVYFWTDSQDPILRQLVLMEKGDRVEFVGRWSLNNKDGRWMFYVNDIRDILPPPPMLTKDEETPERF